MKTIDILSLKNNTLRFIEQCRIKNGKAGQYRYSQTVSHPTLYSSTYAAMTLSLYGELGKLNETEREKWIAHLNSHQDEDGLFRDPVIYGEGWYQNDPLWCGRSHLTCHVLTALTCLGGTAARPLVFLEDWQNPDKLISWLENRNWGKGVGTTGNEIMNIGVLLQYARNFQNNQAAGRAVVILLEWLSKHHLNAATGVWGDVDASVPIWRSHAIQAAYHWWPLFFYDRVTPPHIERAIDTLLATQNPNGGFGWGVHNSAEPFKSSACEDIDSIDPLARMARITSYRRNDIQKALTKAAGWVLKNQVQDGGFVFYLDLSFAYGHPQLQSEANQGAMFPTWFRTLSLAILGRALPHHPLGQIPWHFDRCPGYQF
ncbi:MAG: hypothetical protein PHV34_01035 [Verrucomicrobiae bacterium]|nr:hypothetical protein [Verrucomicrobiae bacterium]